MTLVFGKLARGHCRESRVRLETPPGRHPRVMEQDRIRADAGADLEHVARDEGRDVARKIRLPIRRGGEQLELVADVLARFRH